MPERNLKLTGIVLRKTKLGESDSIVTFLLEDGSQYQAVAKGARKPQGTLSSRLELYRTADILCAQGKTLDIVREAKLVSAAQELPTTLEQTSCAAPIAELVAKVTHPGLEHRNLFALVASAFAHIGRYEGPALLWLCAASLAKVFALIGLRPELSHCVSCGETISLEGDGRIPFSYSDGGVLCGHCQTVGDCAPVRACELAWLHSLLYATFDEVDEFTPNVDLACSVIAFLHQWCRVHASVQLKSVDFLLTAGIFEDAKGE